MRQGNIIFDWDEDRAIAEYFTEKFAGRDSVPLVEAIAICDGWRKRREELLGEIEVNCLLAFIRFKTGGGTSDIVKLSKLVWKFDEWWDDQMKRRKPYREMLLLSDK
jgi:hypothetical protein